MQISIRFFSTAIALSLASLCLASCAGSSSDGSQASTASTASTPAIAPTQQPPAPAPSVPLAEPAPKSSAEAALWAELRQGTGYVMLFRHALAPGTGDPAGFQLGDCSTQRNLFAVGQQQAVRLGELLRQQNITVSRVLSSQWCRCLETAELMNLGEVEPLPILNSFFQDRSRESTQTEQLRQLILENQDSAGVTVMVTHQVNITAISGMVPQSGAAVVMRAATPGQIEFVGELDPG